MITKLIKIKPTFQVIGKIFTYLKDTIRVKRIMKLPVTLLNKVPPKTLFSFFFNGVFSFFVISVFSFNKEKIRINIPIKTADNNITLKNIFFLFKSLKNYSDNQAKTSLIIVDATLPSYWPS